MAQHNELGKRGEDAAANYLQQLGYKIIERNWINRKYEIDIIACDKEYIIFVEVKTRSSNKWGNPEEAISDSKIRKIVAAADFYVKEKEINLPIRFDVISVIWNNDKSTINHIDDAFLAPVN